MVCTCYDPIIMKIILSRGGKEPEGNMQNENSFC